jgi:hypothetical protein
MTASFPCGSLSSVSPVARADPAIRPARDAPTAPNGAYAAAGPHHQQLRHRAATVGALPEAFASSRVRARAASGALVPPEHASL